jgi:hypothetical protein
MSKAAPIFSVPIRVDEVPETGRHITLSPDEPIRAALAGAAGLLALPRFEAAFDVTRQGRDGLHVTGTIAAAVRQTCVVSLEEIENGIEETVDLTFVAGSRHGDGSEHDGGGEGTTDAPEVLVDGTVDLGAIAAESLMLGIDPYPRKSDAVFVAPDTGEPGNHPFAALAALKKREG